MASMGKGYYKQQLEEFERRMIRRALRRHKGNIKKAAQTLGLSYRQMRYRIQQLEMREAPNLLKPF